MAYQIVILGGGPGGYVAAIRAAQMGAKVAVIEREELGGTCLNRGCIPTKALVASVNALHTVKQSAAMGISLGEPVINFPRMMERKNQVVERLVTGIKFLFKKNKIDLYKGKGRLLSNTEIEVTSSEGETEVIRAEHIIIATGSEPALIDSLGYDGQVVITSNEALKLEEIPKRLLIIGGGVVGCEFACIFAELGSEVTIVDMMPTILPTVDKEVTKHLQSLFKRRGIKVITKSGIREVRKTDAGVVAVTGEGEEITADKILISVGRTLNTQNLGLEDVGINKGSRGEILVNDQLRTSIANIYAVGDVTNKIQLAHVASAQGIAAVENIMGTEKSVNYDVVPNCIYTFPEVAGVGITTQQAEEEGIGVKTGKFPFMALGKAQAAGETDGFVKVIADAMTDRVLGVHIMGAHATDLIAEAALAIHLGATSAQLAETIHAHPTLAEAMMEAAEAVHGRSIHI